VSGPAQTTEAPAPPLPVEAHARAVPALAGLRRSIDVLVALTRSDLRARYGRGSNRVLKWMLDPFALVGVYLLMVAFVLDRPGDAPGLSLACAVVPFQLFMLAVIGGLNCVLLRSSIILNMPFPRALIPVSSALTETAAFGASLFLVALMMVVYGVAPTLAILWLPLVMLVTVLLAVAVAFPAALFGLWFLDLRAFAVNCARALFFVAPGLVPLSEVHPETRPWLELNPLTGLFEAYRNVLLYGHSPAAWQLLYPAAAALLILVVFVPLYRSDAPHFAKVLG
jgi:homopolymeric O-antigen transport system permease protein